MRALVFSLVVAVGGDCRACVALVGLGTGGWTTYADVLLPFEYCLPWPFNGDVAFASNFCVVQVLLDVTLCVLEKGRVSDRYSHEAALDFGDIKNVI